MPLQKCSSNGMSGWKYGNSGKCYTGPDGKKKAIKQGLAENNGKWSNASNEEITEQEIKDVMNEQKTEEDIQDYFRQNSRYFSQKERQGMSKEDFGDPDTLSFPVKTQKDLMNAAIRLHQAPKGKQAAIRARLKRIGKRKGFKLPPSLEN